jgi:peptidoglycan/xylan/chitin deacetylase (PgdA/CDA1 family)
LTGLKKAAISAGLETLYFSGTHRLARGYLGGLGAILTFHRVRPPRDDPFQPNRHLEVSPGFLDEVVRSLLAADIDIVSIDEARRRLTEGGSARRFVVLTFDDGYRDNLTFAWPVLERYQVPFVIYVASAFAEGRGELWWLALEEAIAASDRMAVTLDGAERVFDCATAAAKNESYDALYRWLRARKDEADLRQVAREIAAGRDIDMAAECRRLCMGWDELAHLARRPLVTIGSHTVDHVILNKMSAANARAQMANGAREIEARLGVRPQHFAYPVGDHTAAGPREFAIAGDLGFKTAVTTRPGVLFAEHASHLTALPRISVNGEFQRLRYLDVLLSGAATALWNRFRRIDAA